MGSDEWETEEFINREKKEKRAKQLRNLNKQIKLKRYFIITLRRNGCSSFPNGHVEHVADLMTLKAVEILNWKGEV